MLKVKYFIVIIFVSLFFLGACSNEDISTGHPWPPEAGDEEQETTGEEVKETAVLSPPPVTPEEPESMNESEPDPAVAQDENNVPEYTEQRIPHVLEEPENRNESEPEFVGPPAPSAQPAQEKQNLPPAVAAQREIFESKPKQQIEEPPSSRYYHPPAPSQESEEEYSFQEDDEDSAPPTPPAPPVATPPTPYQPPATENDVPTAVLIGEDDKVGFNAVIDAFGNRALHKAAEAGDINKVRELIVLGANPNIPNNFGNTPLHSAAISPNNKVVIDALVNHGSANPTLKNNEDLNPLELAQQLAGNETNIALLQQLLEHYNKPWWIRAKDWVASFF